MEICDGRLYVGTDSPAEIIRIDSDDTWDLIVGEARMTSDGFKWPLSGLDSGSGWPFNIRVWRMQEHEGDLYVGTGDPSSGFLNSEELIEQYGDQFGFDLWASSDGVYFTPVTLNGLGDTASIGARSFASTPYGLFLGSINNAQGLQVWLGDPRYTICLPHISSGSGLRSQNLQALGESPILLSQPRHTDDFLSRDSLSTASHWNGSGGPQAPGRLESETVGGRVVLSWYAAREATRYHVFRSEFTSIRVLEIPDLEADAWLPGPYVQIGTTDRLHCVDPNTRDDGRYYYYVLAEDYAGRVSRCSNLARAPSLMPEITFKDLRLTIADWADRDRFTAQSTKDDLDLVLAGAYDLAEQGRLDEALRQVDQLRLTIQQNQSAIAESWYAHDLEIMLGRLARHIRLAQLGLLPVSAVE